VCKYEWRGNWENCGVGATSSAIETEQEFRCSCFGQHALLIIVGFIDVCKRC